MASRQRQREMVKASDLFAVYRDRLRAPQGSVIKEVVAVVHEVTGFPITEKQCKYAVASRTITFQVPAAMKQEIKMYQADILVHLRGRLGDTNAPTTIL